MSVPNPCLAYKPPPLYWTPGYNEQICPPKLFVLTEFHCSIIPNKEEETTFKAALTLMTPINGAFEVSSKMDLLNYLKKEHFSVFLSLCLSVSLSLCLFVSLPFCLSVFLFKNTRREVERETYRERQTDRERYRFSILRKLKSLFYLFNFK